MAVTPVASRPRWPVGEIDPDRCRVLFGLPADELVVRFPDAPGGGISSPIEARDEDSVAILVDASSGEVVGIHVYPLLAGAAKHRPAWRRLAEPDPPAELVGRFVAEVRDLFERYWRPASPVAEQLADRRRTDEPAAGTGG